MNDNNDVNNNTNNIYIYIYIYIYIHMKDDPEYSVDKDAAPTLSYEGTRTDGGVSGGAAYGGRKV